MSAVLPVCVCAVPVAPESVLGVPVAARASPRRPDTRRVARQPGPAPAPAAAAVRHSSARRAPPGSAFPHYSVCSGPGPAGAMLRWWAV